MQISETSKKRWNWLITVLTLSTLATVGALLGLSIGSFGATEVLTTRFPSERGNNLAYVLLIFFCPLTPLGCFGSVAGVSLGALIRKWVGYQNSFHPFFIIATLGACFLTSFIFGLLPVIVFAGFIMPVLFPNP
jgi:hypothetical protein